MSTSSVPMKPAMSEKLALAWDRGRPRPPLFLLDARRFSKDGRLPAFR
jgi:hypothetical protein